MLFVIIALVALFLLIYVAGKEQLPDYQPGDKVVTRVAGVSFGERQKWIANLEIGDILELVREPYNINDPNAIKVMASRLSRRDKERLEKEVEEFEPFTIFKQTDTWPEEKISKIDQLSQKLKEYTDVGYLPRNLASKIAPIFDKFPFPNFSSNKGYSARVVSFGKAGSQSEIIGVTIGFELPTKEKWEQLNKFVDQINQDSVLYFPY